LIAGLLAFAATPAVAWLSVKIGAIDHPNDRKVHAKPTPTLGGLAIFIGLVGAGVAAMFIPAMSPEDATFREILTQTSAPIGILAAGVVIFALGAVDDMHALPAPVKLAGQVFASGILFLSGLRMNQLFIPNGDVYALGQDVSVLVTVAWLVLMINAVNLIDGLDGLAAGIVAISGSAFFVYTYRLGGIGAASAAPIIAIIVVGASLGFLRHNFHPARIFMGDSGSMTLGLVLGAATIAGIQGAPPVPLESDSTSAAFLAYAPLLIPLSVVALPIADAVLAVIRRARKRRSVFHADKEHLHHRLMDLGHGHRQAVLVMYVWSALAAGAALAFSILGRSNLIFVLPVAVAALVLYTLFPVLTKVFQERTRL
jgi:UDP-GlcNAc:undecaprenyl-phosphate GlcNAc-1-phosphate transferase